MNDLGIIYQQGLATDKDYKQSLHWYLKVATRNYVFAMTNLAILYYGVYRQEKKGRILIESSRFTMKSNGDEKTKKKS